VKKNALFFLILLVLTATACNTKEQIVPALSEEVSKKPLALSGTFPEWLNGTFVRNSSIPLYKDGKVFTHEFDGLAMLHGFAFDEGKVFYTNRFVRSKEYDLVMRQGSSEYVGFAQGNSKTGSNDNSVVQNASVNVFRYPGAYQGSYVALTEVPLPVRFSKDTLETEGNFEFQDALPKEKIWESAHPHYDAARDEIVNYFTQFGKESFYLLYRMPMDKSSREVIAKLPAAMPSYMHSFSITKNYVIITEYPFLVSPADLMKKEKPFIHNFQWLPERNTCVTVVKRSTGSAIFTKECDPFFSFHHGNAYEDEKGDIVLDLVAYSDLSSLESIFPQAVHTDPKPSWDIRLLRLHLLLKEALIETEALLDGDLEFPRVNDSVDGLPYRYLYMTCGDNLVKFDHETKESQLWGLPGYKATEPVFVLSPDAKSEDDGVILSVVNGRDGKSPFLVVLDAKSFSESARAEIPWNIPGTFHGNYFKE
jgi:carotenoid cleavage dioxygenase-like enzyme